MQRIRYPSVPWVFTDQPAESITRRDWTTSLQLLPCQREQLFRFQVIATRLDGIARSASDITRCRLNCRSQFTETNLTLTGEFLNRREFTSKIPQLPTEIAKRQREAANL
jgi:hypothetical protein